MHGPIFDLVPEPRRLRVAELLTLLIAPVQLPGLAGADVKGAALPTAHIIDKLGLRGRAPLRFEAIGHVGGFRPIDAVPVAVKVIGSHIDAGQRNPASL